MGTVKNCGGGLIATVAFAVVDSIRCGRERVTTATIWANAADKCVFFAKEKTYISHTKTTYTKQFN